MIKAFSDWTKNLSLSLIVVSILEMILPNNKTKKYVNVIMGLYVLFNVLSPIISYSKKIDYSNIDIENYTNKILENTSITTSNINQLSMNKRLEQLYNEQLENDITKKLENKGYIVDYCKVISNIDGKENSIEKINLKIFKKSNLEEKTNTNQNENSNSQLNNILIENSNSQQNNISIGNSNSQQNNISIGNSNSQLNSISYINEVKNIKKVNINISNKNPEKTENKINNKDITYIKEFITKEYGVDEKCLTIN